MKCRRCNSPATHQCELCAEENNGAGFYCDAHAKWHNDEVRDAGGSIFAIEIQGVPVES